jgi:DNA-directed RNA polymerase specialized sigma24 family protein
LLSRGVPQDHAQDAAQTAWLRGWERLYQLRDEKLLCTWINTIALNMYRRSMSRDRLFQQLGETIYAGPSIDEASIDLARVMRKCRPEDRNLLKAQLAGVTAEEFAGATGASRVAIRIRFLRARRAARSHVCV